MPFKAGELTRREKAQLSLNKLKYGAVVDQITNLNIKVKIRHLGGVILRKLKIIK